ncbi:MAG: DUF58 domain-containing protein [Micropruina sp.]|nr:DUF58 domain-containing protein [Micropruina sp.]
MVRLSARGLGVCTAGAGLLVTAALTGLRPLAWAGGALLGLMLAAAVLAAGSVRRPGLSRTLVPARVPAGSTARVDLELRRHGVGLGTWSTLSDTTPPELIGAPVLVVPGGWGEVRSRHAYLVTSTLRGRYRIGPALWAGTDPLGLAETRRRLGTTTLLSVTPAIHPLGVPAAVANTGFTGDTAQRHSGLLGADDALIREYRPRDELRRVHWPSTARAGTLMVRREEHAQEPSALILLDNRAGAHTGTGTASSFEWAVSAAASIGMHLLAAGFSVDLIDADGSALPAYSDSVTDALLDALTDVSLSEATDLSRALAGAAGQPRMLIAVLGRLSAEDATALTEPRRDGRLCRAIVQHPAGGGDDPADILRANRWRVVTDAGRLSVGQAWTRLESGPAA